MILHITMLRAVTKCADIHWVGSHRQSLRLTIYIYRKIVYNKIILKSYKTNMMLIDHFWQRTHYIFWKELYGFQQPNKECLKWIDCFQKAHRDSWTKIKERLRLFNFLTSKAFKMSINTQNMFLFQIKIHQSKVFLGNYSVPIETDGTLKS